MENILDGQHRSYSMKLIIATELLFNQERKTMNEEKNETRWDRLLAVRTTGRDDTNADQYRYPYELRLIQFWNVWQTAD